MRLATKIAYNTIIQAISKIIATILGLVAVFLFAFGAWRTNIGKAIIHNDRTLIASVQSGWMGTP